MHWSSDRTLRVPLADLPGPLAHARVLRFCELIRQSPPRGLLDITPAYASVQLTFNPAALLHPQASDSILSAVQLATSEAIRTADALSPSTPRLIEIPVCYDNPDFAPDLPDVAAHCNLTPAEVIRLHASADYTVHFIGFSPGFPYLHGLPAPLTTPRLSTPRTRIPPGSVAIGGPHTGIYPLPTPGGWRIIGRTPLALFDPASPDPSLLRASDRVRFVPISRTEFDRSAI